MEKIMVLIEDTGSNYGAFCPYIDGCVSTGATIEETKARYAEALKWHREGMMEDGCELPPELKGEYELQFYRLVEV